MSSNPQSSAGGLRAPLRVRQRPCRARARRSRETRRRAPFRRRRRAARACPIRPSRRPEPAFQWRRRAGRRRCRREWRPGSSRRCGESTGVKITISASTSAAVSAVSMRPPVLRPVRRTPPCRPGCRGSRRPAGTREARRASPRKTRTTVRPAASHASAARMPGPPALVTIATRRPARQRLRVEARGHVEHLVDRVGADDPGLLEQRVDRDVAGGERGGVAAGRARPRPRPSGLHRDDRLRRARSGGRAARTGADCRTIRGRAGSRAVAGSASQYCSRSLPETSALLPTLTNVDKPTPRSRGRARGSPGRARRSATTSATRPAGGT